MTDTDLENHIRAVLRAQEADSPTPDDVMHRARGIRTGNRSERGRARKPAIIAASVATVAAAALAVVLIPNLGRSHSSAATTRVAPSVGSTTSAPSSATPVSAPPSVAASAFPAVAGSCGAKSNAVTDPSTGGPVVVAHGDGIDAQGLVMSTALPVPAGTEVKIVWRITGSGTPKFSMSGPGSAAARLTFGPSQTEGSNWSAPGDEWVTSFVFPTAGCWSIQVTRTTGTATAWLGIAS